MKFLKIKTLFCKHKNSEVDRWHWMRQSSDDPCYDSCYIEVKWECKDCGKYHFSHIKDWNECGKFIEKYPRKQCINIYKFTVDNIPFIE